MICRICGSSSFEVVLDLGNQPWCNNFLEEADIGSEPTYPLRLVFCTNCRCSQLDFTVAKEIMFGDHTYLSGVTKSLSDHFFNIADSINLRFGRDFDRKNVLDIGSNDGTQLKHYQALGWDVLGVESSKITSKIAIDAGVPTLNKFFNLDCAKQIGSKYSVVNAAGVFFHLEELHSVAEGIREILAIDGIFVVQFLYMKSIMENLAFDQIYHEHLLYYTLETIQRLLDLHGLEMFDAELTPIHGGQMVGYVGHRGLRKPSNRLKSLQRIEHASSCNGLDSYLVFASKVKELKKRDLEYLNHAKNAGKRVFGMGAPVKGNTLLNYFGIGTDLIPYLLEKNELRKGLYSPGMHIPILMESEVEEWPEILYVLAWNFKDEILRNRRDLVDQGVEFYFPINPSS
jgi:SAM-dependent methyltransferase